MYAPIAEEARWDEERYRDLHRRSTGEWRIRDPGAGVDGRRGRGGSPCRQSCTAAHQGLWIGGKHKLHGEPGTPAGAALAEDGPGEGREGRSRVDAAEERQGAGSTAIPFDYGQAAAGMDGVQEQRPARPELQVPVPGSDDPPFFPSPAVPTALAGPSARPATLRHAMVRAGLRRAVGGSGAWRMRASVRPDRPTRRLSLAGAAASGRCRAERRPAAGDCHAGAACGPAAARLPAA